MSELRVDPGIMHGVELGGKKYVAEEPVRLGTFLARTTLDGVTLLTLLAIGAEYESQVKERVTRERLDQLGGGVGWWYRWPTQA